jgi:radical SAM protein with 4Fe4S-binding SPASM domain
MIIPSAPVFVNVELTPYCNNRCPGCGNVFTSNPDHRSQLGPPLNLEQWKIVLLKLRLYVDHVRFTGGEPTLHPEFEDILCFASNFGIPFSLFTNGRWKEPEHLLEFLKQFPQFQGLLVSLHGASAGTHEAFSGVKGSFREAVANVRTAVEAGLAVNTSTVVTKYNYNEIGQILEFVFAIGVSAATIGRHVGKDIAGIKAAPMQLKQAVERVKQEQREEARVQFSACIPQCFVRSSAAGCTAGYTFFTIDPWGNVRPCNHAPILCGNLLQQSLGSIWHSESLQSWRSSVPIECKSCSVFSSCHGGCRAEAMAHGVVADPLMEELGVDHELPARSCREIILGRTDLPVVRCHVRSEPFGYLLVCGAQTAPVSHKARAILDACDGTTTLEKIRERFGQKGLDFVGALVERRFIELLS